VTGVVRFFPTCIKAGWYGFSLRVIGGSTVIPYLLGKNRTTPLKNRPFHWPFSSVLKTVINCQIRRREHSEMGRDSALLFGLEWDCVAFSLGLFSVSLGSELC
jgi:hypothetical protein